MEKIVPNGCDQPPGDRVKKGDQANVEDDPLPTDLMIDKALELGADAYVTKPVTVDELEKALATAFYKHVELRATRVERVNDGK